MTRLTGGLWERLQNPLSYIAQVHLADRMGSSRAMPDTWPHATATVRQVSRLAKVTKRTQRENANEFNGSA
jgi:hypothetical protein